MCLSVVKSRPHCLSWLHPVVRNQDSGLRALFLLEELLDARDIPGNVDADRVMGNFGDTDAPAVFEPAELFELLDFFELALRESGVFEKGIALENVEAEMLPIIKVNFLLWVAHPGDGSTGKIECVVVEIEHCFDDVRVHNVAGMAGESGHGGDVRGRVFKKRSDGGVDSDGIDQRLVSLNVDEDVAGLVYGHFGDAFGSGAMIGAGHAGFTAERLHGIDDALVVGGDEDAADGL